MYLRLAVFKFSFQTFDSGQNKIYISNEFLNLVRRKIKLLVKLVMLSNAISRHPLSSKITFKDTNLFSELESANSVRGILC